MLTTMEKNSLNLTSTHPFSCSLKGQTIVEKQKKNTQQSITQSILSLCLWFVHYIQMYAFIFKQSTRDTELETQDW